MTSKRSETEKKCFEDTKPVKEKDPTSHAAAVCCLTVVVTGEPNMHLQQNSVKHTGLLVIFVLIQTF